MNVSSVASAATGAHDLAASRVDESAPSDAFATLFAAMLNATPAKPPAPVSQADGLSDLDHPEAAAEGEDAKTGSSKSRDANDPATTAAATSSSNEIVRSLAALDPQLQEKLARVMTRVRQETGHDVSVNETFRTQARQNQLFAQGRSTAGQVVTWTQHSKHTEGRAVDVVLDGGAAGSDAYRALQRIATEEGLATLGPRDPGHLELRGRGPRANGDATPQMPVEPADATGPGSVSIARLAQVARVAEVKPTMVARPAHANVAQVASVAQVGAAGTSARTGSDTRDSGSRSDSHGYTGLGVTFASRDPNAAAAVAPVVSGAGAEAMARAERVLAARDAAPARTLSQITMNVDAGNGATDRVHVSLRGESLNTTIDTGDARAAQVMAGKTDELARALDKQGIELESLRVRSADSAGTIAAPSHAQTANGGRDAYSQSRFDRGDAWQQQQDQQERGRSQQGRDDRRQQREQRGGRK